MIAQQINLYQHSLKPALPDLRLYAVLASIGVVVMAFVMINIYILQNFYRERDLVEQMRKQLAAEQAQVQVLASKVPKQQVDATLLAEIKQWQEKLDETNKTIAILQDNNTVHSKGFSDYFQALANNPLSDVWLTTIHFDVKQKLINFEGNTFKTDKIPIFLQQLQKETVFHGRTFATLEIEKAKNEPELMHFKLSTQLKDLIDKPHVN